MSNPFFKEHPIGRWDTFHQNGPFNLQKLFEAQRSSSTPENSWDSYNQSTAALQALFQRLKQEGKGFRAYGSGWSLSHIAHHPENMWFHHKWNGKYAVEPRDLHANTGLQAPDLFFFQSGNRIKQVSQWLFQKARSLKTTGESNGQTLGGVVSTGVHGSALNFGSIQDYVYGLHLITGSEPGDSLYLEPASRPALSDAFALGFSGRIIRNDELFYAALVGLGAFGYIQGMLIHTEPLFLLTRYVGSASVADAVATGNSLDFSTFHTKLTTHQHKLHQELNAQGKLPAPYHFKFYINPFNAQEKAVVEMMYKKPWAPGHEVHRGITTSIPVETLSLLAATAESLQFSIPALLNALEGTILPKPDEAPITAKLSDIFWDSEHRGSTFAVAFGFPSSQAKAALDLFLATSRNPNLGRLPGAIGVRFVKKSAATLAFTRFDVTCVIELDGVLPKSDAHTRQGALDRLHDFAEALVLAYQQQGIPFTLHWGKNAPWKMNGLAQSMYQSDWDTWKDARNQILKADWRPFFHAPFLKDIGLP